MVLGSQTGAFCDAGQHFFANFIGVVEGSGEVRVAVAFELLLGAAFDDVVLCPADAEENFANFTGF